MGCCKADWFWDHYTLLYHFVDNQVSLVGLSLLGGGFYYFLIASGVQAGKFTSVLRETSRVWSRKCMSVLNKNSGVQSGKF